MARELTEKELLLRTIQRAQDVRTAAEDLAEELAEDDARARQDDTGL